MPRDLLKDGFELNRMMKTLFGNHRRQRKKKCGQLMRAGYDRERVE
jgi:hypothetical protein